MVTEHGTRAHVVRTAPHSATCIAACRTVALIARHVTRGVDGGTDPNAATCRIRVACRTVAPIAVHVTRSHAVAKPHAASDCRRIACRTVALVARHGTRTGAVGTYPHPATCRLRTACSTGALVTRHKTRPLTVDGSPHPATCIVACRTVAPIAVHVTLTHAVITAPYAATRLLRTACSTVALVARHGTRGQSVSDPHSATGVILAARSAVAPALSLVPRTAAAVVCLERIHLVVSHVQPSFTPSPSCATRRSGTPLSRAGRRS